jgi:hypothetical protein
MARIAITQEASEAIVSTINLGSVGFASEVNARGERLIWLDRAMVQRLNHLRDRSETLSDVIRLRRNVFGQRAAIEAASRNVAETPDAMVR